MKRILSISTLLTIVFSLAAPAAHADMMTYDGLDLVETVKVHGDGLVSDGKTVYAGRYLFTYQGRQYKSFCVDLDHWAGTTEVSEESVSTLRNGDMVAYLYETYAWSVTDKTSAAALGVAIWETLYETLPDESDPDFGAGDGSFYITNNAGVRDTADGYLATLPDSYTPMQNLVVLHSQDKQDMLIGSLGEVPEPMTAAMLLLATPFVLRRRMRRAN